MVCYSDKTKTVCGKIIIGVGIILIGLGILVGTYGWLSLGAGKKIVSSYVNLNINGALPSFTIAVGILCIVTGLFAIFTGWCKKPWFTIPFMFCTFSIGVLMIIVAALAGGN
jgi:hypothetical protein